jgi:hypothetical protein
LDAPEQKQHFKYYEDADIAYFLKDIIFLTSPVANCRVASPYQENSSHTGCHPLLQAYSVEVKYVIRH